MQTSEPSNRPVRRKAVWIAAGCYLLFIVYGSLVPLDFNPRPVDVAWLDFLRTPYLVLGIDARADWIANILLYMPLAYLFSAALAPVDRSRIAYVLRTSAVFVACAVIAVAVEFTQLFFPPRTVSINDVVAEVIGSGLGIVVWLIWSGALERLWREMKYGGLPAIRAAVVLYVLAYLILSLFPYDFLVSLQELSQKLAAGGYGFVMASGSCMRLSICSGKLLAEIIAVMPVGVLLSMVLGKDTKHPYATGALCGLALGLAIETAQLFIASGVSEGISLVTRAAGLCLGVFVQRRMRRQWLFAVRPLLAGTVLSLCLPYLLGLTWVNGWFEASWDTVEHASRSLAAVNWLPFYYHYYTTETAALVSALAVIAMYLPVGIGYWLWRFVRVHPDGDGATIDR